MWSFRLTCVSSARAAERVDVDGEAVVLRGDLDLAGGEVHHRLVAAVVAELELVGRPPSARPRIWWPRQMPKIGTLPISARDVLARVRRRRRDRPGRSRGRRRRASCASTSARRRRRRHDAHAAADADEVAQDVALDAEVVGDDEAAARPPRATVGASRPPSCPGRLVPIVRRRAGDLARRGRGPTMPGAAPSPCATSRVAVEVDASRARASCAPWSRRWRTSARVSMPCDAGDAVLRAGSRRGVCSRAPVARRLASTPDDEARARRAAATRRPRG